MSSDNVPFGLGVLSQGEIILSPEADRLLAKKSWLFLYEYLLRNDEKIKAVRIPVPWSLFSDADIEKRLREGAKVFERFSSPEKYREYYKSVEAHYADHAIKYSFDMFRKRARLNWIFDSVIAENPLTVLDVGAGYGEMAVMLARAGIQVTALNLSPENSASMRAYLGDEALPLEWITGLFEQLDFKDTKFDLVLCGEVLEHVYDDLSFLQKCVDLAKQAVIVTTPIGSCEAGFLPNAKLQDEHVRAYSKRSFADLLNRLTGVKKNFNVHEKESLHGFRGQPIKCFCVRLEKEVIYAGNKEVQTA